MSAKNRDPRPSGNRSDRPRSSDADRRAAKRAEIVEFASGMFGAHGYRSVTMGQIADHFGFTKPALYYYVGKKENLLIDILGDAFDRLEDRIEEVVTRSTDPVDWVRGLVEALVQTAAEPNTKILATIDLTDGGLEGSVRDVAVELNRRQLARVVQMISTGQEMGAFRTDLSPTVVAFGITGMCTWVSRWYESQGSLTPAGIASTYSALLVDPLVTPGWSAAAGGR